MLFRSGRGRLQTDSQRRRGREQQGGQRWGDATMSQGCWLPLGAGRGRKDPPPGPQGSPAQQTPAFQPRGTDFGLLASRTVVLPIRAGHKKLVRCGTSNPEAQRLSRQSVILAWGLRAGRSSADQAGLPGAGPVPSPSSSWDRQVAWGMRSVQEEQRELCDA